MRGRPNRGRGGSSGWSVSRTPSRSATGVTASRERDEVLARRSGVDPPIGIELAPEPVEIERIRCRARQAGRDHGGERLGVRLRHGVGGPPGALAHLERIIRLGPGAAEDVQVEGRELDLVEAQRGRTGRGAANRGPSGSNPAPA